MNRHYKVWVHIETIDEYNDYYEDEEEPQSTGIEYATKEEAMEDRDLMLEVVGT